jgi:hypothetical protein
MQPGEFGLQVRLPQGLSFNHLQNTRSRSDAGVTQLNRSDASDRAQDCRGDAGAMHFASVGKRVIAIRAVPGSRNYTLGINRE